MLNFTGSNPQGFKAQVRHSEMPYDTGYSVFTWRDDGTGVILWREQHELAWNDAYSIAQEWLNK